MAFNLQKMATLKILEKHIILSSVYSNREKLPAAFY